MYKIGDFVIYGNTGVCRVEDIIFPEEHQSLNYLDKDSSYYILKPIYQSGTIYSQVDNDKVFMRPIISKDEAKRLMSVIPEVCPSVCEKKSVQELKEYYESRLKTHECSDLIEVTMSIYLKKEQEELKKRKLKQIDIQYMKKAEEMLSQEFATVLDIPKVKVLKYISEKFETREQGQ